MRTKVRLETQADSEFMGIGNRRYTPEAKWRSRERLTAAKDLPLRTCLAAGMHKRVGLLFSEAPFIQQLGIRIDAITPGICRTSLDVTDWMRQQHGYVHACVQSTLADHTAAGAALSMGEPDSGVVTVEFKMNFLRPATAATLRCEARVLRPGRTVTITEADVFAIHADGRESLTTKALLTMAVSPKFGRK